MNNSKRNWKIPFSSFCSKYILRIGLVILYYLFLRYLLSLFSTNLVSQSRHPFAQYLENICFIFNTKFLYYMYWDFKHIWKNKIKLIQNLFLLGSQPVSTRTLTESSWISPSSWMTVFGLTIRIYFCHITDLFTHSSFISLIYNPYCQSVREVFVSSLRLSFLQFSSFFRRVPSSFTKVCHYRFYRSFIYLYFSFST